ncbi:unnamed protein product [Lampetra fluviatilis]
MALDGKLNSKLRAIDGVLSHPSVLPATLVATVFIVLGLHAIFSDLTTCSCYYSAAYGVLSLLGPALPFAAWLLACCGRMCCSCGRGREVMAAKLRRLCVPWVAYLTWLSAALLDTNAVCCIMNSEVLESECRFGDISECKSISKLFGMVVIFVGFVAILIVLLVQCCLEPSRRRQPVPAPAQDWRQPVPGPGPAQAPAQDWRQAAPDWRQPPIAVISY